MNNSLPLNSSKEINPKLFFLLFFLYQLFFTLQGLDLSDEGFFCTFYQQIFDNPDSVQYNFMFWLSGIVGGAFHYVFGSTGVLGLRIFAALMTTGSVVLVYNLLKKYLVIGHLQLGLAIVLLLMNNNTKVYHYNYLSVLFYVITAILLFRGLKENKFSFLFISGLFIALDTFSRIPSVVNLGLALAIFYFGFLNKTPFKKQLLQVFVFGAGFVVGVGAVLMAIKAIGHWDVFVNAIILVGKLGSGAEESAYGMSALIMQFVNAYFASLKVAAIVLAGAVLAAASMNYLKTTPFYRKWFVDIMKYAILLVLLLFIVKGVIDNFAALYFMTGLSLICGLLILVSNAAKEMKLLTFIGCFILMAYPLGSGAGLYSVGIYSLWFSFPIALDFLFNIRSFNGRFDLGGNSLQLCTMVSVQEKQFIDIKRYIVLICIVAGLYYSWYYPFFDYHQRTKMTYTVNNDYLKGVRTTRERATVMTELLNESTKYVKPGDYTLAYHSIPMFHAATKTIPFVHNSMPWFYQASVFKEELDLAVQRTNIHPVVVIQKRKTVGRAGSTWPDPAPYYDEAWYRKNGPRDSTLNVFLQENHYSEVWSNEMFRILTPGRSDSLNQ